MTSKQVNVSVTILSVSGLHVKDTAVKKKSGVLRGISPSRAFPSRSLSPARRKKGINLDVDTQSCAPSTTSSSNNNSNDKSLTTVVASFTRMAKKKKRITHVGSIPLKLSSDEYDCEADIQWPAIDTSMQQKEDSSHYRFLHTFDQHEESNDPSLSSRLLLPIQQQKEEQEALQTIQIAISRQGRMFKLGTASIPLSADTRSGSSVYTLPITNCNPIKNKKSGVNKPMMMKLKDDTIKVSMDTDATIKIRVAVEPAIGETVTISERFNVTMITDSMMKQKEMHDLKMKEEQMKEMSLQDEVVATKKKEQPTLEDVSTTTTAPSSPGSTAQIIDDDTLPMIRVLSHPDDEQDDDLQEDTEETQDVEDNEEEDDDDEASCSSSAYMSVPSKYQGHNLSVTRSNSTTTTDISSVVSDLTEGCSFLSQNGIEVVPFNTTPDDAKLSSNPNINTMLIDSKEGVRDSQPNLNSTQSRAESEDTPPKSSFPHRAAADNSSSKKQTWRERFSCVGLNSSLLMCGDNNGNDISETLSSVIEEDVVSTNKYSLANLGRCHNPLNIPSASYYTDDGSFVEDDEDSDDDDESSSSSESSGGRDGRYTALEGALFG